MTARLLTAEQVCDRFGIPSPRTLRTMRAQGLAAVRLGRAYLFDAADVEAFIESRKERPCPDRIEDRASTGSQSEGRSISYGMSAVQNASAQRARQIASELKRRSHRSSAQVIDFQGQTSPTR